MFSRLLAHITRNNIFHNKQFGFRNNLSTLYSILSITDLAQRAIDSDAYPCGIFLDLRMTFDTVDHKILLEKFYGAGGIVLDWFSSYLSDRWQYVRAYQLVTLNPT